MPPFPIAVDRRVLLALVLGTVSAASCGGSPAAPQAPASLARPIAGNPPGSPPELGPVPPPAGLVLSGVLTRLGASLGTVHGWTQLSMPQAEQVTDLIAGEAVGAIVDLDQPIDFAVSVSGEGTRLTESAAISAGVRDVDAAKNALSARHRLVPGDHGVLLIQRLDPSAGAPDDDEGDARVCELAPSYGAPAMRLVCGWDAKALAVLGPWLTRGATRDRPTSDGRVQLRMQPLQTTIAGERRLLSMLLGTMMGGHVALSAARQGVQAVGGDVADFAADLDTASLDVDLNDAGAVATLTLHLPSATSALAKLATANADRNGPPPAAFWQMPDDADFAAFVRGIDPNVLARGRDIVLKVADDQLAADGVKDADRHAVIDALAKVCSPAPTVYASGVDADAVRRSLAAVKALPDETGAVARREAHRVASQAWIGWRLIEVDEPAAVRIDALKALTAAWGRPSVVAAYRGKGAGRALVIRTVPLPKDSALPKGTVRFAIDLPFADPLADSAAPSPHPPAKAPEDAARAARLPKPLAIDVFVVPDGARTWIGVGGDSALVASRLVSAVSGSGDGLRARPELAALKDAVIGAGGFFTARGLPEIAAQMEALGGGDPGGLSGGAELFESAAQLPHQGTTPIPFSLTASAGGAGAVVATVHVPRATVDDVLVVALKHGF